MRFFDIVIKPVLLGMVAILLGAGLLYASEIDDVTVFVEAFNAFQKKDYLLAIAKGKQHNQVFPDSPLRDVTLLLIARSGIKSGDNELAAKTINKFTGDFSDSALTSTIEEELLVLGARKLRGEPLLPNKQLQAAALKIQNDRLEQERFAALKLEQEKLAKEKAELDRIAKEKAEAERKEQIRLAAEKVEKEGINAVISIPDRGVTVAAGQNASIPIGISNRGKNSEVFLLEVAAANEYGALLASADKPDEAVKRIKLAAGETFNAVVLFRMPFGKLDGHREPLTIKTISDKYSDVTQTKKVLAIASAPLVRVVAKLAKPKITPGEQLHYQVTLLNIGTLSAQNLIVKLQLPPQLDFLGSANMNFRQEQNRTLVFEVERIDSGKLADITLEVKVKENSRIGQELRGQVEVINGQLQRNDIFTASASVIQTKQ